MAVAILSSVEKESGAEGEEVIGDSQEPLNTYINILLAMYIFLSVTW